MSRSMERYGPAVLTGAAAGFALVCPAGHKYEVIELDFKLGGAANQTIIAQVHTPAGSIFYVDTIVATTLNVISAKGLHEGVVLYAGDKLEVYAPGSPANTHQAMVTFIDVDFNG